MHREARWTLLLNPRNTTSPILAHGSRHMSKKKYCFWENKFHNIPAGVLEHFEPADQPLKPQSQHRKDNQNIWTSFSYISSILRPQTKQNILLSPKLKVCTSMRGTKQNERTQSVDGTFKITIACTLQALNTQFMQHRQQNPLGCSVVAVIHHTQWPLSLGSTFNLPCPQQVLESQTQHIPYSLTMLHCSSKAKC